MILRYSMCFENSCACQRTMGVMTRQLITMSTANPGASRQMIAL